MRDIKRGIKIFAEILKGSLTKMGLLFVSVVIFNILGALMEGAAYCFIIMSFSALSKDVTHVPDILNHILGIYLVQNAFLTFVILAVVSQILKSIFCLFASLISGWLSMHLQYTVQNEIYKKILKLTFPCVNRYKVGELTAYAQSPLNFVSAFVNSLNLFFGAACLIVVSLAIMTSLSFYLTLFTLALLAVALFFQKWIVKRNSFYANKVCKQLERFNVQTIQNLEGLRLIHLYNYQQIALKKIGIVLKKFANYARKLSVLGASNTALNEVIGVIVVSLCMMMGYWILSDIADPLPLLLGFITVTYRLVGKIQGAMANVLQISGLTGYYKQMLTILDESDKELVEERSGKEVVFNKEIKFRNVSLAYPASLQNSINNFSIVIPKGKVVALVGESGAGKSSLLDLLTGLYPPTFGTIMIDDEDLSGSDIHSWRELIGVVSQDSFILNDTIENNIRFGKLNATQEEIVEAAKNANAHQFIMRLPQTYKTVVGERGYRLSGGERQRIALARALIRNPAVLILDEATSSLDSESEKLIQNAFERYRGEKTVIVVAHRLSTVKDADHIHVLNQGALIESGNHKKLIESGGQYAKFWQIQYGTESSAIAESVIF